VASWKASELQAVIEITAKVAGNVICSLEKYWRLI